MTDRKQALTDLLAKVEAGDDRFSSYLPLGHEKEWPLFYKAFDGSIDAAKALHEAVLPYWDVDDLSQNGTLVGHPWGVRIAHWNASDPSKNKFEVAGWGRDNIPGYNPARAWLIAILKALIEMEQDQ